MRRCLYIGGFELPDKNAAAQRTLSVAKALKDSYEITFLGLTHSDNLKGIVNGFYYENLQYPNTKKEWVDHLRGAIELEYVKKVKPDIVIAYNYPALALYRLIRYCKRQKIIIVGDITEWYHPHNILKWIDTEWRMRILNKKMDGLILISRYLDEYYKDQNRIKIPPTIDLSDKKWHVGDQREPSEKITLMYAGSPGRGDKDRLDNLISVIGYYSNLFLNIVGVSKEDYTLKFPKVVIPENVKFWGRLSHEITISMLCESDFSIFFRQPSQVNNAGFPTKFVEAQSAGIPVIANHFSDLDEYVEEGRNGFLAKSISLEDIDEVLKTVSALTKEKISEMHNYTKSLKKFDFQEYKEELLELFGSLKCHYNE